MVIRVPPFLKYYGALPWKSSSISSGPCCLVLFLRDGIFIFLLPSHWVPLCSGWFIHRQKCMIIIRSPVLGTWPSALSAPGFHLTRGLELLSAASDGPVSC